MKRLLAISVILLFVLGGVAFAGDNIHHNVIGELELNNTTNNNNSATADANATAISGSMASAYNYDWISNMNTNVNNVGQSQFGYVSTKINVEKPNTQIPVLNNFNIDPYEGSVYDITEEFAKYDLAGVTYASENTKNMIPIATDKFNKLGMMNEWEARKHIYKKTAKLKRKWEKKLGHPVNVCVVITARQGSHSYGMGGSSAGSANPQEWLGAMGGGSLGWSMNLATSMCVVEFFLCD